MADKPSRALILYGHGLARLIGETHSHLHSFASHASCCFLTLPKIAGNKDTSILEEFAELLDANEALCIADAKVLLEDKAQEKCEFPTVEERFMGMKAALITDNLSLKKFGSELGLTVFNWNEVCEKGNNVMVDLSPVPSGLLTLLGFQEGKILDDGGFDLVFVHVEVGKRIDELKDIELMDNMVGEFTKVSQSRVDVGSRLHLSVVMSYGANQEDDNVSYSFYGSEPLNNKVLSSIIPRQSYSMKGGKPRENISNQCPMLLAQYQNAVTRKDMVEKFSFREFSMHSGNLVIPADRFFYEVAFKLWKAPKYGA